MSQYSAPTSDTLLQQSVADQSMPWIHASSLAIMLANLKNFDITTQAGRTAAFESLTSNITGAPYQIIDGGPIYATSLRFGTSANTGVVNPATIYFALFCDGWASLCTQVALAVGYRDRAAEKSLLSNTALLEVDQSRSTPDPSECRSQYNDSVVSYRRAIDTMYNLFRNGMGRYNYKTFEQKYQLVWSATAPTVLTTPLLLKGDPLENLLQRGYSEPATLVRQPSVNTSDILANLSQADTEELLKILARRQTSAPPAA